MEYSEQFEIENQMNESTNEYGIPLQGKIHIYMHAICNVNAVQVGDGSMKNYIYMHNGSKVQVLKVEFVYTPSGDPKKMEFRAKMVLKYRVRRMLWMVYN